MRKPAATSRGAGRRAPRVLPLRRDDACIECGQTLPARTKAQWDEVARTVTCLACASAAARAVTAARPTEATGTDTNTDTNATTNGDADTGTTAAGDRPERTSPARVAPTDDPPLAPVVRIDAAPLATASPARGRRTGSWAATKQAPSRLPGGVILAFRDEPA